MKLFIHTRPVSYVPGAIKITVIFALLVQFAWHAAFSQLNKQKYDLITPAEPYVYRLVSLDDSVAISKFIMLWLQAFDNQPGISLSLRELDYDKVSAWLAVILQLDKLTQYPLLAAARFYAEVPDIEKQKKMIHFIQQQFLLLPNKRWPAMAHAVYVAKHRIKDEQLAAECARLLRLHATADNVPYWAKQMEFFVLEDMGELEAAKILIGGLLDSGTLKDKQQQRFLADRLADIERRISEENDPADFH